MSGIPWIDYGGRRGRGKKGLYIPVWVIAEAAGLNEQTVRRHIREGGFDRGDFGSVVGYVNERRKKGG